MVHECGAGCTSQRSPQQPFHLGWLLLIPDGALQQQSAKLHHLLSWVTVVELQVLP